MSKFLSWQLPFFFVFILATGCGGNSTDGSTSGSITFARWASIPVALYADPQITLDPNSDSDLQDALNFWNQKAGKQVFDFRGASSGSTFTGDAADPTEIFMNSIVLQDPWPFSQGIVGKTHIHTRSNSFEHGLILLDKNGSYCTGDCSNSPGSISRRKLIAHELGHLLGLNHVNDVNNIMNPEITSGGVIINLSVDTEALNKYTN